MDGAGSAYISGYATLSGFPVTPNAVQTLSGGGDSDVFVVKLNPAASALTYATYLGGGSAEQGSAIAVDEAGHAYVTGRTTSSNFPTTEGAFSRTVVGPGDAFVTKLNSRGTAMIYSTVFGGGAQDGGLGIKIMESGHAYVAGSISSSANFPTTGDALSSTARGSSEAFLTVFEPRGAALTYSTLFGGNVADEVNALALDDSGNAYLGGGTTSQNIPTTAGVVQPTSTLSDNAFIAKFSQFGYTACPAPLGTTSATAPAAGSSSSTTVAASANCNWNGIASVPFVSVTAGSSGTGSGNISYAVAPSTEQAPRAGAIAAGGNFLQLIQNGETQDQPYGDIAITHQFFNHVTLMKNNAITSGCTATDYCPDGTTTRAQMAVFIIRALLGGDSFAFPQTPYFTDVPASHQFFKWIQKMREFGITTGCGTATYCPDDPVTRGQMAVFIFRALVGNTFTFSSTPYFSDVPATHGFFPFVQKMKEWGVTSGCTATSYCVDLPTTRGQMAVFIIRAFFSPR